MRNRLWALGLLVSVGCSKSTPNNTGHDGFTDEEWKKVQTLGPLGSPKPEPTNRFAEDDRAAALGQRLFFEKSYSGALTVGDDGTNGSLGAAGETGKVACASCHDAHDYFTDTRSHPNNTSLGVKWTARNAPSLVNVAYYDWHGWTGKEDSLWYQGANSPESGTNTGGNRLQYAHMVFQKYRADYDAIFPVALDPALDPSAADAARFPPSGKPKASATDPDGPWELMAEADRQIVLTIMANCGKSLEAYERRLVSKNAPLDRYVAGESGALSASAKRGLKLFIGKAGCVACHSGTTMTDQGFHATGVPQAVGDHVPATDNGRNDDLPKLLSNPFRSSASFSDDPDAGAARLAGLEQGAAWVGMFRTKSLRHLARTAPYFHNGSMATLEAVVDFYDQGGGASGYAGTKDAKIVPLNLSASEKTDLVTFLRDGLLGEPVPDALMVDTSAP